MPKWYGEVISRKGEYEYNGKHVYAYYGANCGECPEMRSAVELACKSAFDGMYLPRDTLYLLFIVGYYMESDKKEEAKQGLSLTGDIIFII